MITVFDASCLASQPPRQTAAPTAPAREPLLAGGPPRPRAVPSATVLVSGRSVETWNDEFFRQLRRRHNVPDGFLNTDKEHSVDLKAARAESKLGKGGETQHVSRDAKFIVKSVSGDDHKALLERAQAYVERLLTGASLLVPIYLHFRDPSTKKVYIAMRNLTPEVTWDEKYDLKGCADDKTLLWKGEMIEPVHKRFYRADMWSRCMWTKKRHVYYDGKVRARALHFDFPTTQRNEIVRRLHGDAEWLKRSGLMDYSLFVAIRRTRLKPQPAATPGNTKSEASEASEAREAREATGNGGVGPETKILQQYAMLDGESMILVTLGIIDFLQPWTTAKKIARCIKSLEFNKATIPPLAYADRFQRHFAERLRGEERLKPLDLAEVAVADNGAAHAWRELRESCESP
mmetsp:Transcript_75826/g.175816  ORF Transcript_75826/g.175816 Transcript_75826/m.175816 type:complete len:404 (+) Transcript_75826:440-1651(+)